MFRIEAADSTTTLRGPFSTSNAIFLWDPVDISSPGPSTVIRPQVTDSSNQDTLGAYVIIQSSSDRVVLTWCVPYVDGASDFV